MKKRLASGLAVAAVIAILGLGVAGVVESSFVPSLVRGVTSVFAGDSPAGPAGGWHGSSSGGAPGAGAAWHGHGEGGRPGADNGAAWGTVGWYGAILAFAATVTVLLARAFRRFR